MSRSGYGHAYWGLTQRQKMLIKMHLTDNGVERGRHAANVEGDRPAAGWFIQRTPTTVNPPKWLNLVKRSPEGKLQQVIVITENGVTK